jgi:hypothetical protein
MKIMFGCSAAFAGDAARERASRSGRMRVKRENVWLGMAAELLQAVRL